MSQAIIVSHFGFLSFSMTRFGRDKNNHYVFFIQRPWPCTTDPCTAHFLPMNLDLPKWPLDKIMTHIQVRSNLCMKLEICTVLPLEKYWPDTTAQTDGPGETYLPKNVAVLGCNNQYALMCNYRCVDGVGSRSILRLFTPSTQLDEGVVVEDSTNSFFTPTMQLDEVGIVMHIVESRLLRGEPPPCELHAMFTNLWKSRVGG